MMNFYSRNIRPTRMVMAVVEMPDHFDALDKDFRYQLTVIATFAQAIIAGKMKANKTATSRITGKFKMQQ